MVTGSDIVREARGWVGVPFQDRGRSRRGVDCAGLVLEVGKACNALPESLDCGSYGVPRTASATISERLCRHLSPVSEPEAGAVIVLRGRAEAGHLAICGGDTLIHATRLAGRVIEHSYSADWRALTASAWRMPGVTA